MLRPLLFPLALIATHASIGPDHSAHLLAAEPGSRVTMVLADRATATKFTITNHRPAHIDSHSRAGPDLWCRDEA